MAFDLTKPSMTDPTWAAAFGNVRENFRAIVQGDAGVFTQMQITSTASPHVAALLLGRSGQTVKARVFGIGNGTDSNLWLTTNASFDGTNFNRGDVARPAWGVQHGGLNDRFSIFRASAAANPIAWTEVFRIDAARNIGIGNGAPAGNRVYVQSDTADTTTNVLTLVNSSAAIVAQFRSDAFIRFGAATPAVRLHVGAGGTGTVTEQIRIDAGSGSGGDARLEFARNGLVTGYVGRAGAANSIITGAAENDLCIRNSQAIGFSTDGGATMHARLDNLGAFFATRLVATAGAAAVAAGQIAYGGTTATTVGAAGGASALPATPVGYIVINVAGTNMKVPYYNN